VPSESVWTPLRMTRSADGLPNDGSDAGLDEGLAGSTILERGLIGPAQRLFSKGIHGIVHLSMHTIEGQEPCFAFAAFAVGDGRPGMSALPSYRSAVSARDSAVLHPEVVRRLKAWLKRKTAVAAVREHHEVLVSVKPGLVQTPVSRR